MRPIRPLRRALLNLAGAAFLVLLVASVAMWAGLGRYNYGIIHMRGQTTVCLTASSDALAINHMTTSAPFPYRTDFIQGDYPLPIPPRTTTVFEEGKWEHAIFGAGASGKTMTFTTMTFTGAPATPPFRMSHTAVFMPFWLIAVLCVPLPLWLATLHRRARTRHRRRALGQCAQCGYDLRATPGRCPECGADAEESPAPL